MPETSIRPTREEDIQRIVPLLSKVFPESSYTEAELAWLLDDPQNPGRFRSFVGFADDRLIGHIGYVAAHYRIAEKLLRGVHPIAWAVDPSFRGVSGLQLLARIYDHGDFSLIIGGSAAARRVFWQARYQELFQIQVYRKLLHTANFCLTLKGPLLRRIRHSARILMKSRAGLDKVPRMDDTIRLEPYCSDASDRIFPPRGQVFVNTAPSSVLSWMRACPLLESYGFQILKYGRPLGIALCYVKRYRPGLATGRIVHLSFIHGDTALWKAAVSALEIYLLEQGCCAITAMASYPRFQEALTASGYEASKKPVWVKDPDKVLQDAEWHLTFLEGDLAYRDM